VKVFLIALDHRQSFFYSEDDADDAPVSSNRSGWRGWLERSSQRVTAALRHPQGGLLLALKRCWDWLQRRMHPDERLLAALRKARVIEIHHPASHSAEAVLAAWRAYLRRRVWRHLGWLVFDGLLAPLSVFLWVLPGPNVIGYWFAYRAVLHVLILLGIRRALRGRVETIVHPVAGLDHGGDDAGRHVVARAATQYELKGLHAFVARIAPGHAPSTPAAETETGTEGVVEHDSAGSLERPCDC
jgi:hypothetical protein